MKINPLIVPLLLAATLPAFAAQTHSSQKANDKVLQDAFECRAVAPNIETALASRRITQLDGETHTTLHPPITVLGFKVSDVTVFGNGGEQVYSAYVHAPKAVVDAAVNKAKATWPSADGLSAYAADGGFTRLECSMSPSADADYD